MVDIHVNVQFVFILVLSEFRFQVCDDILVDMDLGDLQLFSDKMGVCDV